MQPFLRASGISVPKAGGPRIRASTSTWAASIAAVPTAAKSIFPPTAIPGSATVPKANISPTASQRRQGSSWRRIATSRSLPTIPSTMSTPRSWLGRICRRNTRKSVSVSASPRPGAGKGSATSASCRITPSTRPWSRRWISPSAKCWAKSMSSDCARRPS